MMLVYFHMARKKGDVEMSILIEPPDFAVLALEPYDQLKSSPFLEQNSKKPSWKNMEKVFLADDQILIQAILASAKIVHMDSLCSSLVILFESRGAGSTLVQRLMLRELMEFKLTKGNTNNEANPMPYRGDSAATKGFYFRFLKFYYYYYYNSSSLKKNKTNNPKTTNSLRAVPKFSLQGVLSSRWHALSFRDPGSDYQRLLRALGYRVQENRD